MHLLSTFFTEVLLLEPALFEDERGFFYESFNEQAFSELFANAGKIPPHFVQDNHSFSNKNVIRGLHYQLSPPQGKLVRVIAGEIFDVVLDIRPDSATFGQWKSVVLSACNRRQLWIPPGFAHGFMAVADGTECLYKVTSYWNAHQERCLLWDDPVLAIPWPLSFNQLPVVSKKDQSGRLFSAFCLND